MSVLPVRTFTDPVLRKKAQPVVSITPEIEALVRDMIETMYFSHGIGLAGPQVGVLLTVVTIDTSQDSESYHPRVFINPRIVKKSARTAEYEEGCLSVPGYHASVVRPEQITVEYLEMDGTKKSVPVKGILARVLQHEIDHLNGVLFTDHLEDDFWQSEDGLTMEREHPRFTDQTRQALARVSTG